MVDTSSENMTDMWSEFLKYENLYNAVRVGNLNEIKVILESLPEALNKRITVEDKTALHIAVENGHEHIVEELVNQMSDESLAMHDDKGWTALILAAVYGKWRMAECMLKRKPDLISIGNSVDNNRLPVVMAIDNRQLEMAQRLYYRTPDKDLIPQDNDQKIQYLNAARLLNNAIYTETLDIALDLIRRCPSLALAVDDDGVSPILALASMHQSFSSDENQLGFWKKRIYYYILRTPPWALPISETRLNFSNREQGQSNQEEYRNNRSVLSAVFCYIVSGVLNFCGIKQLYEMKKIHVQRNELLSQMCKEISGSNTEQLMNGQVYSAINLAVKNGNFVFLSMMLQVDRRFLWSRNHEGANIFMQGVLHRQEKIINILYRLDTMINYFASFTDHNKNNMLHLAGMISEDSTRVNQIRGTALQMQRELQWFKEIERIVHPKDKEATNNKDKTPQQLFIENHKNMMKNGEKWMKDTAWSCTVVGALIVTIMFTVAFAIPGGNNQTTGFPIFLKKKLFMLFIISDALSLFSSTTSVLMFLGILTSRCAEEDFLEYLPRQMIIGLLTLFCSIATMMITFSSALLIILHEQLHIAIPLIFLASVPITFFVRIQFPILKDMIISTYGPGMFDKKMKSKLI